MDQAHYKFEFAPGPDALQARVVLIFKKGATDDLGNYRPLSLLNTYYKLLAALLQRRLAQALGAHQQWDFRQ